MMDYNELVTALRCSNRYKNFTKECYSQNPNERCRYYLQFACDDGCLLSDAAAAIDDLQARLGEAENSVERWKDMYLTKHEPKRGEWELIDEAEPMRWGCSRCKYMSWETSSYCPRCGAKMEVQDGTD